MIEIPVSFCRTLEQWTLEGGNLEQQLAEFRQHTISTESEVHSICHSLDALHNHAELLSALDQHPLPLLAHYFRGVVDPGLQQTIINEGLPVLRWFVADALAGKPHQDHDLMIVLEVLAQYRQKEDVSWIYKAILHPIAPNDPQWFAILATYRDSHPYLKPFVQALAKHLPPGRACLAFLKLCDHIAETKQYQPHAFNGLVGIEKLKSYLHPQSNRPQEFARAAVRTAALLEQANREILLSLADQHPEPAIAFLASVTRAALGDAQEAESLVERCRDVRRSYETQLKLKEIGMDSLIPEEALRPEFLPLAQTSHWLEFQSELHRAPDRLALLETRDLFWLPRHQQCRLYLVKYEYDQPVGEKGITSGVAVVGSVTHSLIGETDVTMDAADVLGLHCCWELEALHDPLAPRNRTAKMGRNLLRKHNPNF